MKGAVSAIKLGKADCDLVQRQVLLNPSSWRYWNSHSRILKSRGATLAASRAWRSSYLGMLIAHHLTQRHYSTHQYRNKAARSDSSSK